MRAHTHGVCRKLKPKVLLVSCLSCEQQSDIGLFRQVMTLTILRGERAPTEEEAFLEDGGSVPSDASKWWDPPQEDDDDDDDEDDDGIDGDVVDDLDEAEDDVDDEVEDDRGWERERESGGREGKAGAGAGTNGEGQGEVWGGGRGHLDLRFEGARGQEEAVNGFDLTAGGAHEDQAHQAHAVDLKLDLDRNLSAKSDQAWSTSTSTSTFPGEQSNGNGNGNANEVGALSPVWASTIE